MISLVYKIDLYKNVWALTMFLSLKLGSLITKIFCLFFFFFLSLWNRFRDIDKCNFYLFWLIAFYLKANISRTVDRNGMNYYICVHFELIFYLYLYGFYSKKKIIQWFLRIYYFITRGTCRTGFLVWMYNCIICMPINALITAQNASAKNFT